MKTKLIIFISMMLTMFSITSCLKISEEPDENKIILPDNNEVFQTNSQKIAVRNAVSITFSDGQTIVDNPFEGYGVTVNVDKQNVTINAIVADTKFELNYVLSGVTTNGSVKIYSDYKFGLLFNGVSIQNPKGAAINIQSGKRVSVTLVDHTSNRLVDEGIFQMTEGEDMKGTFFSEGQLVFDGTGSLLIYANYRHAICVDDYIEINSGSITVNNVPQDGIRCKDYFQMEGGNINILMAKSDGLECGNMIINGGSIKVSNTSDIGLKSNENITITGGKIEIDSRHGIRAEGNIAIIGGEIYCNSSRNGIVSREKAIIISGGLIVVSATRSVFDSGNRTFSIIGGTTIGVGGASIVPTSSECRQRVVVWGTSGFTAGQLVSIKSSNAFDVMSFKLPKAYTDKMVMVFSSSSLYANTSYTINKGGSVSGGADFHGLYIGAVSNGGTAAATFTTSNMVAIVGNVN